MQVLWNYISDLSPLCFTLVNQNSSSLPYWSWVVDRQLSGLQKKWSTRLKHFSINIVLYRLMITAETIIVPPDALKHGIHLEFWLLIVSVLIKKLIHVLTVQNIGILLFDMLKARLTLINYISLFPAVLAGHSSVTFLRFTKTGVLNMNSLQKFPELTHYYTVMCNFSILLLLALYIVL